MGANRSRQMTAQIRDEIDEVAQYAHSPGRWVGAHDAIIPLSSRRWCGRRKSKLDHARTTAELRSMVN
jgi:hypothetical protein